MDARRRRQRGLAPRAGPAVEPRDDPPSAFEAVTRQMVEAVSDELRGIRDRVDNLLWMIAGAIVLDTALRVMGT